MKTDFFKKEEIQKIFNESNSYTQVLKKIGLCSTGGSSRKTIKKYIKENNIDLKIFNENYKKFLIEHRKNLNKES